MMNFTENGEIGAPDTDRSLPDVQPLEELFDVHDLKTKRFGENLSEPPSTTAGSVLTQPLRRRMSFKNNLDIILLKSVLTTDDNLSGYGETKANFIKKS